MPGLLALDLLVILLSPVGNLHLGYMRKLDQNNEAINWPSHIENPWQSKDQSPGLLIALCLAGAHALPAIFLIYVFANSEQNLSS